MSTLHHVSHRKTHRTTGLSVPNSRKHTSSPRHTSGERQVASFQNRSANLHQLHGQAQLAGFRQLAPQLLLSVSCRRIPWMQWMAFLVFKGTATRPKRVEQASFKGKALWAWCIGNPLFLRATKTGNFQSPHHSSSQRANPPKKSSQTAGVPSLNAQVVRVVSLCWGLPNDLPDRTQIRFRSSPWSCSWAAAACCHRSWLSATPRPGRDGTEGKKHQESWKIMPNTGDLCSYIQELDVDAIHDLEAVVNIRRAKLKYD